MEWSMSRQCLKSAKEIARRSACVGRCTTDRRTRKGSSFKPGPSSKHDPAQIMEQAFCKHPYAYMKWGANDKSAYASCLECGLKTRILYNRRDVFISEAEDVANSVRMTLTPGLVMIETGCRAAVDGKAWHQGLQKASEGAGQKLSQRGTAGTCSFWSR